MEKEAGEANGLAGEADSKVAALLEAPFDHPGGSPVEVRRLGLVSTHQPVTGRGLWRCNLREGQFAVV